LRVGRAPARTVDAGAHGDSPEIPIIAANLHRLMQPRQSQIWAVLHKSDSDRRLTYSLAATFLGRMCLSGEIAELTDRQWELVRRAQQLYRSAVPIIKHGTSRRYGATGESWRHPTGWQTVVRESGDELLVVTHTFADAPTKIDLPSGHVIDKLGHLDGDFSAEVRLLSR
jgi:alpha-galactosidase